ncbi:MAG: hypothetical protein ACW97P_04905 [Candidatus Hodarchaeales archaeon]
MKDGAKLKRPSDIRLKLFLIILNTPHDSFRLSVEETVDLHMVIKKSNLIV